MTIQGPIWTIGPGALLDLAARVVREQYGSLGPAEAYAVHDVIRTTEVVALLDAAHSKAGREYERATTTHWQAIQQARKQMDVALASAVTEAAAMMKQRTET